jgi:hypothetical protein
MLTIISELMSLFKVVNIFGHVDWVTELYNCTIKNRENTQKNFRALY